MTNASIDPMQEKYASSNQNGLLVQQTLLLAFMLSTKEPTKDLKRRLPNSRHIKKRISWHNLEWRDSLSRVFSDFNLQNRTPPNG
jgi:hypothetical protein